MTDPDSHANILAHNRIAWDKWAQDGDRRKTTGSAATSPTTSPRGRSSPTGRPILDTKRVDVGVHHRPIAELHESQNALIVFTF